MAWKFLGTVSETPKRTNEKAKTTSLNTSMRDMPAPRMRKPCSTGNWSWESMQNLRKELRSISQGWQVQRFFTSGFASTNPETLETASTRGDALWTRLGDGGRV